MIAYTTYHIYEAEIVAGRLKAEGIVNLIHRVPGASAMGIHVGALGEIKVLVHPADYDLAQAILFPDEPDTLPDDANRIIFDDDDTDE